MFFEVWIQMLWRRRWNVIDHPIDQPILGLILTWNQTGVYSMDGDYGVGKTQRSQGHWDHIGIMAFFYMGFNWSTGPWCSKSLMSSVFVALLLDVPYMGMSQNLQHYIHLFGKTIQPYKLFWCARVWIWSTACSTYVYIYIYTVLYAYILYLY